MSDDHLGPVLSAQPWRILCALREAPPQDADPILRPDEHLGGEAHTTLCHELRHVLLPELAADGFVEFDAHEDRVWQGPRFETVRPLLDRPQAEFPGLDAGPFAYDEQTGTVRYYPDGSVEKLETFVSTELDD